MVNRVTGGEQEDVVIEPEHQEGLARPVLGQGGTNVSEAIKEMLEGAANTDKGPDDLPKVVEVQPALGKNAADVGAEQITALAKSDQPEEVAVPSGSRASRVLHKLKKLFINDVIDVYATIIKNPKLLITGTLKVLKDTFWELPKSLIKGTGTLPLKERCEMKASQALALSEVATFPGTILAIKLFRMIGAGEFANGIVGASIGNYISGAVTYIAVYLALTAVCKQYGFLNGIKDAARVIKNVAPTALVTYIADAPATAALMGLGLSAEWAAIVNFLWGTILFTGVASAAANQEVAKKK
ncbi:MAG: hypothetical protein WCT53_03935 [Candidatus Gracilibacteria bacterium]